MTTPAQEGIAAAKSDDEARAKKVFVLQYHSFDKSDRDDGDWIIGVFQNELEAMSVLADDLESSFGGITFESPTKSIVHNKDGSWKMTEWGFFEPDGFKYILTPTKIK
jgi:hypothetical protein